MSKHVLLASIAAACAAFVASQLLSAVRADDPKPEKPAAPPGGGEKDPKPKEQPAAPAFKCKDVDGKERTLDEFKGKWIVLEWTNMGCPFVKKFYNDGYMQGLQKKYMDKGVVWLSVCSSAEGKEGYLKPEDWKKTIADKKIVSTAVLLDYDGTVGHAYGAANTPQVWLVGPKGTIAYTGAMDDTKSPKANPADAPTKYLVQALDAVLDGKEPPTAETQPYG